MFDTLLKLYLNSFYILLWKQTVRRTNTIIKKIRLVMIKIYLSETSDNGFRNFCINKMHKLFQFLVKVSVGLNCIDSPKFWIGHISKALNRWYIDIAINDDGPNYDEMFNSLISSAPDKPRFRVKYVNIFVDTDWKVFEPVSNTCCRKSAYFVAAMCRIHHWDAVYPLC